MRPFRAALAFPCGRVLLGLFRRLFLASSVFRHSTVRSPVSACIGLSIWTADISSFKAGEAVRQTHCGAMIALQTLSVGDDALVLAAYTFATKPLLLDTCCTRHKWVRGSSLL